MTVSRYSRLLLASAATVLVATPACAQQSDPAPAAAQSADTDQNDIIVTAQRREERLQDVPISITAFNQAQITNRNIVTAGDLAIYTPSLSVNGRFGSENATFAIRGFVQEGGTAPSVGLAFADVPSPRVAGAIVSGNGFAPGTLFDLESVQVLKGPQGTLQGRNTTGGTILLVPKKPTDRLEGYVEGTVGDYDLLRVQAVINAPLGDTVRLRLSGDRMSRKGYLNNVSAIGPKDFGDVNYYAIRGSLVWDVTPEIENYTIATYNHSDTHGSVLPHPFCVTGTLTPPGGSAVSTCADPATPNFVPSGYRAANYVAQINGVRGFYDVSNVLPDADEFIEQWQVINTTTWHFSDTLTAKNIISFGQFRERQTASIYGDDGVNFGPNDPAAGLNYVSALIGLPGKYTAAESTFTEEFQLQGRSADDRFVYQGGVYYERSTPIGVQTVLTPGSIACTNPVALQCTDIRGRLSGIEGRVGNEQLSQSQYWFSDVALYAQGTYKITDKLSLTAGFRYTWDEQRGLGDSLRANFPAANTALLSCVIPPAQVDAAAQVSGLTPAQLSAAIQADPTVCNFTREQKSSAPTWLINLDYKPVEDAMLYAKYSRGYRPGGVNVTSYGYETWKPEKVDLYEIGAKTSWHGSMPGHFNIAGFYNNFTDQLVAVGLLACSTISLPQCPFIPGSGQGFTNAGKSTIKGFEIDAGIRPFVGFELDASYTFLDAKIDEITPPTLPLGFTFASVVTNGSPIPLTPRNQYTISGTYTLPLDPRLGKLSFGLTFAHRDSTFGSTSSFPAQQTLPAQNLLNLNVNWNEVDGLPLDLGLFVTNLTNEQFITYAVGKSFGFDAYVANQPRMFGVRAKVSFGRDREAPPPPPPPPAPVQEAAPPPPPPPPPAPPPPPRPGERG